MSKKRMSSIALLVLACLLVIAGCGEKANKEGQEEKVQPEHTSTSTRIVEHPYGKTEIPVQPKRIATYLLEDSLISLDVPFIYSFDLPGYYLHDQIAAKNIPTSGALPLNVEAVAASNPDLIIISQYAVEDQLGYDKLNLIAPTIAYDPNDWEGSLIKIGEALGLEDKAAAVISAYKEHIIEVKDSIVKKVGTDKTVALIRPLAKDWQLFYPTFDSFTKIFYEELGLNVDESVAASQRESSNDWGDNLSLEVLPKLKSDYIFSMYGSSLSDNEEFETERQSVKDFEKSSLWKNLPAVQSNQVGYISGRHWMTSGFIADKMKLDDVLGFLTK
ncbi:ABC transporter substrate-binding protein [Paenibacillus paeoniae]|nr:ABC transporter substrate-binding protein [Paenibacillus paeoniae]